MTNIAILGIHTGIGKTIAAAVIAEAIGADYWKPVQAGLEERDTTLVSKLLTNGPHRVHKEAVVLSQPMSPHAAAIVDNVEINYKSFDWPVTGKPLIIETAGGVLSPISADSTIADFVLHYQLPSILIVKNYLGSINHTLLCLEVLKSRNINLLGIIINGEESQSSESFISAYGLVPIIARIPEFDTLSNQAIASCAGQIKQSLIESIRAEDY